MSAPSATRPLRVGMTGGIGSGKSTVAAMLVELGAVLVDTDAIARSLTSPGGTALPAVAAAFGDDVLAVDGALDRDAMRQRVFSDPEVKLRLEAILHPLIGAEATRQAAAACGPVLVFDVPLLTESTHWRARVDKVLVVDCTETTQVLRVAQRPGWDQATAGRVLAQQAPRTARRAIADALIHNDGISLEMLSDQVRVLWACWTSQTIRQQTA